MRRFASDRKGSVITVFAFSAMVLSVMTAIVMNQVSFYLAKRKLQSAVDMAALVMMEKGDHTAAAAKALIEEQLATTLSDVTVTRGTYVADASVPEGNRFQANATPFNAIQVSAALPAEEVMFADMIPEFQIAAQARASRRTSASVQVGSRLVRLEGGLSAALLDALLGYKGKLTVMDYESLAAANVDALQLLQVLNVKADIKAVTFDDVLSAPVSVGKIVDAMAVTTTDGKVVALLKAASVAPGAKKVEIGSVIDLGSMTGLPVNSLLSGKPVPVSVGELLTATAAISDGDHQVAVKLDGLLADIGVADASLEVGEKPRVMSFVGRAPKGAKVETTQFKLNVGALGLTPLTAVKLDVAIAGAQVEIDEIKCKADGSADVVLKAKTEAASVGLKASILPRIAVKLGNDESKKLTFSKADIDAQTYKPVRSGLGLNLNGLSIAQKLLFNPVDNLLEKLGLHVAEADVKVTDATCGSVGLVH